MRAHLLSSPYVTIKKYNDGIFRECKGVAFASKAVPSLPTAFFLGVAPLRARRKKIAKEGKKVMFPAVSGNGKLITSFLKGGALAENTKIHSIREHAQVSGG